MNKHLFYNIKQHTIGYFIVAYSEHIEYVSIGNNEQDVINELIKHYPDYTLEVGTNESLINDIVSLVDNDLNSENITVIMKGTEFQEKVWNKIRSIPRGETRTYTELAQELNIPTSVRAVANACGANKIAILIPCHRVVGSKGQLTGYRWGMQRKEYLLDQEKIKV